MYQYRLLGLKIVSTSLFFLLFLIQDAIAAPRRPLTSVRDATLSVIVKDHPQLEYFETEYRITKGRSKYKIFFPRGKEPEGLYSGLKVSVKGRKRNATTIDLNNDPSGFQVTGGTPLVGVGGVRQVVVLRIQSATSISPATNTQIATAMQEMDSWFQESSYQSLLVKNDADNNGIPDIYTVSISASSAGVGEGSAFTFCNSAKSAAQSQHGLNLSVWNHYICILPPDMNYSWFGQAYINGQDVVINGNFAGGYAGGYTHEVGHNLGLHHSNTPGVEYGESACVMGGNAGTARRDFNGPHKAQLAWLPISSVSAGQYEINAVEDQPSQRVSSHTVLKIRDTVGNQDLYISYRSPLGTFGPGLNTAYRTSIHSWPGGATQTVLLGSIGDGENFSLNGITVQQVAHTSVSASVILGAVCTPAAPTLTLDPTSLTTNNLGAKTFTILLKNNDVNCSTQTDYSLTGSAPSGWTVSFGSANIQVPAGQTAATSVTVTPSANAADGTNSISFSASAAGHATGSGSTQFRIDRSPPSIPTGLKVVKKGQKVTLTWSAASDSGSGVAKYQIFRNGSFRSEKASSPYSENPGSGTFTYTVASVDNTGNVSAQSAGVSITMR